MLVKPLLGIAALGWRRDGRRGGDLYRRDRGHGHHDLGAVLQGFAAGDLQPVLTVLILHARLPRRRTEPRVDAANGREVTTDGQEVRQRQAARQRERARPIFGTVGFIQPLPGDVERDRPARADGVLQHASKESEIVLHPHESQVTEDADGRRRTAYSPKLDDRAAKFCAPANSPTFKGIRSEKLFDKLNFLSLMLALFCGTASLPHILIRYYTVKDAAAARKSTIVGIACIGFFYVLTLYMGLGAMTSGALDVTDSNMAAPLLARELQRAALRGDFGDRVHDGARHGERV